MVRGDQRGRELGFPTANLICHRTRRCPPTACTRPGWSAAASTSRCRRRCPIGTNPTFSGRERRVEAYVLDFSGDLYGERLALDFVAHLRGQIRYDSIEPLIAQMNQDVERTRRVLA